MKDIALNGMTVNERLYALNLNDSFDDAIKNSNYNKAISILLSVKLTDKQATETVQAIFKNPSNYGY